MNPIIFLISMLSILCIILLSVVSIVSTKFDFFPPPNKNTWQYKIFWLLFRLMFLGLIGLSVTDFNSLQYVGSSYRFGVGLPLLIMGFSAAIYLSLELGWKNAHGEQKGLVISGCYRWSRNPVYVVSIIGMIGWGLLVDSLFVYIILSLWGGVYLIAPFLEEPWLEKKYGAEYVSYKSMVSRYLGLPAPKK
jgi:protein-S-isoprenylcysteine O-methyltransferase Ste14